MHTVESILVSVISLLSSDTPNTDSPANIDAAKQVRGMYKARHSHTPEDIVGYRKKVRFRDRDE